jgi:hypothetical protein
MSSSKAAAQLGSRNRNCAGRCWWIGTRCRRRSEEPPSFQFFEDGPDRAFHSLPVISKAERRVIHSVLGQNERWAQLTALQPPLRRCSVRRPPSRPNSDRSSARGLWRSLRTAVSPSCSRMFRTVEPRAIWAMKAARPIGVPSGLVSKKSRCPALVSSSRSSHANDAIHPGRHAGRTGKPRRASVASRHGAVHLIRRCQ